MLKLYQVREIKERKREGGRLDENNRSPHLLCFDWMVTLHWPLSFTISSLVCPPLISVCLVIFRVEAQ